MGHQPLGGRPVGVVRAHADVPFPTEDPKVGDHPTLMRELSSLTGVLDRPSRPTSRNVAGAGTIRPLFLVCLYTDADMPSGLFIVGDPARDACGA